MNDSVTLLSPGQDGDPLLACLLVLAKQYGSVHSAHALVAGLPLVDNRLTPDLFIRAAARANLQAVVVEREFSEISNVVLPAVLLLKDNRACIVQSLDGQTAVLLEEGSGKPQTVARDELMHQYTGYGIYVRPDHGFDKRSAVSGMSHQRHWFWSVMAKSWRIYRDVLLASLMINLFALCMPLFTMNVYDRVVPNHAVETLWMLALGITVVFLFDVLLKILRGHFIELAGKKADVLLSASIFEHILDLKLTHRSASVGSLASQLREFDAIKGFMTSSTITALVDIPFIFIFLAVIAFIGGELVWVPLIMIPLVIAIGFVMEKSLRRYVENGFKAGTQKNATLVESLTAIETIKSLGMEGKLQRIWESAVGTSAFWGQKSRLVSASIINIAGFCQQLATVLVLIWGVYLIAAGDLSMGGLIACVMLVGRALAPLGQIANLQTSYFQAKTSFAALNDIMSKPVERAVDKTFVHHPDLRGKIQFRNVNFIYPDQKQEILRNVSFTIQEKEKVAIIGRIGSGKSTLLKMMLGLFEPAQGAILVDDIEISQLDPVDLRKNAGYVSQDVTLFYGTLRSNITCAQRHTHDQDFMRAVNVSGVAEFARRFTQGFDSIVGERGENLSGGQRQAIGLARAILANPSIYLLDEPTSQMDNGTEEFIKTSLKELVADKTLVLVTHKTSMLSLVDRILVMDQGQLVADGPRDMVLEALKNGKISVRP